MPVGVIINSLSVVCGGILGAVLGNRFSADLKQKLELILGLCSLCMGISTVVIMVHMPAVVFAVVLGTAIGLMLHLGDRIQAGAMVMQKLVSKAAPPKNTLSPQEANAAMVTVLVLFCASGTGIYGSIVSGFTGDHSILLAKSILDLFTAAIFACNLGMVVSLVAVPQFLILLPLYLGSGWILPLTTPDMICDFKACGGFLMVATGLRMMKIKHFPVADMIPAMILVMPISALF